MTRETRLLIASDREEAFRPLLEPRFPNVPMRFIADASQAAAVAADFAPTVVLGAPGEPVPKDELIHLLNHDTVEWFSNCGAGVEHLGKWDPAMKTVTNAAGVNAAYLAQYTISALITAHLKFPLYARQQRAKVWERVEWKALHDTTICIVGLGNVGRAVADQAKHFGMLVKGTRGTRRPTPNVDHVFGPDQLREALTDADLVSIHAAHLPETTGLIDDDAFAVMKDGVILLNAARGPVVDTSALIRALDAGKVETAILDVTDPEPPPPDDPVWSHERIILTPHMADSVSIWRENMVRAFADNLERWIAGEELVNVVDPARGY
jgi:phosphoglycerate dehydrogenase-like enzyme